MTRTVSTRRIRPVVVVLIALALAGLAIALAPGSHHGHDSTSAASRASRATFHDAMRQLWEDHIVWTRNVIVSVAHDLPDQPTVVDRLLRNQDDIGDAIKPFYGAAAGEELSRLLREHIVGAADLLAAAKAGDADAVADATAAWYANGDEIAAFLAEANPRNWELAEMRAMMRDHLDLTLEEAVARLEGRFADDVAAYDEVHVQILQMADMLSDGILTQFPARFDR